jgi:hypothetical protein
VRKKIISYGTIVAILIIGVFVSYIIQKNTVRSTQIEPIKTETLDFDLETAAQMLEKGEKIILTVATKDAVTRQEYNQFISDMNAAFDGYDGSWEYMFFFNEEVEDSHNEILHINKNILYPTVFHQDIEIVSAQITNYYYEDEHLNRSVLNIKEAYTGQDSKLQGWYRENLYQKDEEENWKIFAFGGQQNFMEDGVTSDFLKLK